MCFHHQVLLQRLVKFYNLGKLHVQAFSGTKPTAGIWHCRRFRDSVIKYSQLNLLRQF